MTKLELIAIAKDLHITKISGMNKAQLESVIRFAKESMSDNQAELDEQAQFEEHIATQVEQVAEPQTKAEPLSDFIIRSVEKDQEILANIKKMNEDDHVSKTWSQISYIKLLECNFKVKVDYSKLGGELALAEKIIEIHNAIRCGKVARRTQSESKARYRAMKTAQYTNQSHREVAMTSVVADKTTIDVQAIAEKVLAQKHTPQFNQMLVDERYATNPIVAFIKKILHV